MDLKLFGKKISLALIISLATLFIVLFTCCSCCHTDNVVEAMTGKKTIKENHDSYHNTQTKMPGTVVNVASPPPVVQHAPHTVPQHTHQPAQHSHQPPFSLNINLKDKKKNGDSTSSSTTEQASSTDASTSGDATTTTEGFSNLDSNSGSSWMENALGYATGMKNEDPTQSGENANYSAENWTPDHTLAFFSNNTKKASCCATSAYSVNSACPCISQDQFKYLSSRGGNHSNGDI